MYNLDIKVTNSNGDELLDKRLKVSSLDEIGFMYTLGYNIMTDSKANEEADGVVFDSEDEAEFNKEDII